MHWSLTIEHWSLIIALSLFGCTNAFPDDGTKLSALVYQGLNIFWREHLSPVDHSEPKPALFQLLQNDTHFVDKIGSWFGTTTFLIVGTGGCPSAYQLSADMSTWNCLWQGIGNFYDLHNKIKQTLRKLFTFSVHLNRGFQSIITGWPSMFGFSLIIVHWSLHIDHWSFTAVLPSLEGLS